MLNLEKIHLPSLTVSMQNGRVFLLSIAVRVSPDNSASLFLSTTTDNCTKTLVLNADILNTN